MNMKFGLMINSIAVAASFGSWQHDLLAGIFAMLVCGFVLSAIDYAKVPGATA